MLEEFQVAHVHTCLATTVTQIACRLAQASSLRHWTAAPGAAGLRVSRLALRQPESMAISLGSLVGGLRLREASFRWEVAGTV